jgi:hypothetical protein
MWSSISCLKGRTLIKGVSEQNYKNIWTKKTGMTGGQRKLHTKEHYSLYPTAFTIGMIKSRRM